MARWILLALYSGLVWGEPYSVTLQIYPMQDTLEMVEVEAVATQNADGRWIAKVEKGLGWSHDASVELTDAQVTALAKGCDSCLPDGKQVWVPRSSGGLSLGTVDKRVVQVDKYHNGQYANRHIGNRAPFGYKVNFHDPSLSVDGAPNTLEPFQRHKTLFPAEFLAYNPDNPFFKGEHAAVDLGELPDSVKDQLAKKEKFEKTAVPVEIVKIDGEKATIREVLEGEPATIEVPLNVLRRFKDAQERDYLTKITEATSLRGTSVFAAKRLNSLPPPTQECLNKLRSLSIHVNLPLTPM